MRSSNRGRSSRRRGGLVYLLIAFAALWIILISAGLFWGGGSETSGGDRGGRGEKANSATGSSGNRDSQPPDAQNEAKDAAGDSKDPATPTEKQKDSAAQNVDDTQDVSRNKKQEPGSSGTRLPRQSSGEEPVYDPLGKGSGAASLSQTDLERSKLAAFRFVDAAYDFEGKGPSKRLDYLGDVGQTVDAPEFWESPESPGSEVPDTVAARINEYGVKNSAAFQSFKVEDTSSERVTGTATFTLNEGDGRKTYSQKFVLTRWAAVWRVLYAKPLEEVS